MSDFVESEAEESEEEYNDDGEVVPRVNKKFVEEEDGESIITLISSELSACPVNSHGCSSMFHCLATVPSHHHGVEGCVGEL